MTVQKFKTYQLALEFYHNAQKLHLSYPLKDQFKRATLSIVLNLAEGSAKPTARDRSRFYYISLGSLREAQALLDIIGDVALAKQADQLGAYLYKLCKNT